MPRGIAAVVILLVLAFATAAVVFFRAESKSQVSDITASVLYADIAAALSQPRMVAVVRYERERSDRNPEETTTIWIDAEHDLARVESTYDYGSFGNTSAIHMVRDGKRYTSSETGGVKAPIHGCPEASLRALTTLGTCYEVEPDNGSLTSHVEEDHEFDGREVLALVTKGSYSGIDSTITVNNALFVDPVTKLPVALKVAGKDRMLGHTTKFTDEKRYVVEFISAASLPADFFEPTAIGYVEQNSEQPLLDHPPSYPVYWLGREYASTQGLPALALGDVSFVAQDDKREEDSTVTLGYRPASDDFSRTHVSLSNWPAESWSSFVTTGAPPPHRFDSCFPPETIATPLGPATLYQWPVEEGRCDPPFSYTFELDTGATVVVITSTTHNNEGNQYASREALAQLVVDLVLR